MHSDSDPAKESGSDSAISNLPLNDSGNVSKTASSALDLSVWQRHQDSLRNLIISQKDNRILKESFLAEIYIRNLASIHNDSVCVKIPFNIHSPDCGAPDCYTTDLLFAIKLGEKFIFPSSLPYKTHEHGCVESESEVSGVLKLMNDSEEQVSYHDDKAKLTLILWRSISEQGTLAYLMEGLKKSQIKDHDVNGILKVYGEDLKKYPLSSWELSTIEYENFIN